MDKSFIPKLQESIFEEQKRSNLDAKKLLEKLKKIEKKKIDSGEYKYIKGPGLREMVLTKIK